MASINDITGILNAHIYNLAEPNREVACGYAGDLLSFVIGKAPTDCVWFTVMSNVNVCAVAALAEISLVVLCEGVVPDEALLEKVKSQGINLASVKADIFSAVKAVSAVI